MGIRLLILTPTALPSVTGNAVTAERWRRSLERRGLAVEVWATEGKSPPDLIQTIDRVRPQVIHVHHAYRAASIFMDPCVALAGLRIPLVVSPAGTDINLDLAVKEKRETVLRILQVARAIIVQNESTAQSIREIQPELVPRVIQVPKSILWFGSDPFDLRAIAGFGRGDILFLLPAGIRPVKGNLECLMAMERVHAARPQARVVFAGPALDPEYAERFASEMARRSPLARWIPAIPLTAMRSAYESADIVLNTSIAKGLSNALLEAIAAGRPVLASDIPGNRGPVRGLNEDRPAGLLFDPRNPADFVGQALRLIDDPEERAALGQDGQARAARWPAAEDEADGLIRAYEIALSKNKMQGFSGSRVREFKEK